MSQICVHADIQDRPCKGSVFSREIVCKAGKSNTCLKRCSPSCPAYKPETDVRETFSAVMPPQAPQRPVQMPQASQTPQHGVRYAARSGGGCGSCGGNRKIS